MECEKADYQDFQWAFGLNRFSLNLIGAWPHENDSYVHIDYKRLRIPAMLIWMLCGIVLPQMNALFKTCHNLTLVIDNLATNCGTVTSCVKLFFLWKSGPVLKPVMRSIVKDWTSIRSNWEHQVMVRQAGRARIFTITGYAIMSFCVVSFIVTPVFGLYIRIINNVTDFGEGPYFPLQTLYPFDATISPYFELIYLSQLIGSSFVGIAFSVPDNFFGALVFHASAQSEILKANMSNLLSMDEDGSCGMVGHEKRFLRLKLRKIVSRHLHLSRFVDAIESSFNISILAQVVSLSAVICCFGFSFINSLEMETQHQSYVQVATLIGTVLNLMMHMFVYCVASEILAEHSLGFYYAIYFCEWYSLRPVHSKDIIIIMMQSKSPLKLSAGKFFYLSLNTFMNIMKTSLGYISMLIATNSERHVIK